MLESVKGDEALGIFMSQRGTRGDGMNVERSRTSLRGVDFLRNLARRFAELPYENVSKIIKMAGSRSLEEAMRLPAEVVTDHVERNFGGTCFSLTFLFERMLKSLGFDCYKVMADMNSGRNVHCLVMVSEGGAKYIVDPGYALHEVITLPGMKAPRGRMPLAGAEGLSEVAGCPVGPMGAEAGCERVKLPHAAVELRSEGAGGYSLFTEDAAGRKWRYGFHDVAASDSEFEEHWLESFTKPSLENICLNRMTPRGLIYLRKDFFKFTSPTSVEKRRLKQGRERLVEQEFGIAAEWVELAQKLLDDKRARGVSRLG